jgi:hypothetical protein
MILVLFLMLFGFLGIGGTGSSSSGSGQSAAVPTAVVFTVDGKTAGPGAVLHPGQVLQFLPGNTAFTFTRLECGTDHRIRLSQSRRWTIPDTAEGPYAIEANTGGASIVIRSHAAPCPAP